MEYKYISRILYHRNGQLLRQKIVAPYPKALSEIEPIIKDALSEESQHPYICEGNIPHTITVFIEAVTPCYFCNKLTAKKVWFADGRKIPICDDPRCWTAYQTEG